MSFYYNLYLVYYILIYYIIYYINYMGFKLFVMRFLKMKNKL